VASMADGGGSVLARGEDRPAFIAVRKAVEVLAWAPSRG
jgi:hypothetical protein